MNIQEKFKQLTRNNRAIIRIVLLGIFIRLVVAGLAIHYYDISRIIALSKSIADSGNFFNAFYKIGGVQLYGKMYYQVIALMMILLGHLHLLNIAMIFDTSAYSPTYQEYLHGFPQLGPAIYQIVLLKLTEFIYDFLILFFILKTARDLGLKRKTLALFWALNPIAIYVGYVMMQSDLAMLAFLLGGASFTIAALKEKNKRLFTLNRLLALVFLAVGAVLKQIPILVLPLILITFSENLLQGIFYILIFASVYYLAYQPWSVDAILLKNSFLNSAESTQLFDFQLNGFNAFFSLYLGVIALIYAFRDKIRQKPILILHLITLIIAVVYLSENSESFFPQFSVWITPFLALLAVYDENYALFLFGALIGFFKQFLVDSTLLSGTLSPFLGDPLGRIPQYQVFISRYINVEIVIKFVDTVFSVFTALLIIYLLLQLFGKQPFSIVVSLTKSLRLNLRVATIVIFLTFCGIAFFEVWYMSQYAMLTNASFDKLTPVELSRRPISFSIDNRKRMTVTALDVAVNASGSSNDDYTDIKVIDTDNHQVLTTSRTSDVLLPGDGSEYTFFLPIGVNARHMQFSFYQEKGLNKVFLYAANRPSTLETDFPQYEYDDFYDKGNIYFYYQQGIIDASIRGKYTVNDMLHNAAFNIRKNPCFYEVYSAFLVVLLGFIIFPLKGLKTFLS